MTPTNQLALPPEDNILNLRNRSVSIQTFVSLTTTQTFNSAKTVFYYFSALRGYWGLEFGGEKGGEGGAEGVCGPSEISAPAAGAWHGSPVRGVPKRAQSSSLRGSRGHHPGAWVPNPSGYGEPRAYPGPRVWGTRGHARGTTSAHI